MASIFLGATAIAFSYWSTSTMTTTVLVFGFGFSPPSSVSVFGASSEVPWVISIVISYSSST